MDKKGFRADSWLIPTIQRKTASAQVGADLRTSDKALDRFIPSNYFVPGWKGDSLPSKNTAILSQSITALWHEAINQLKAIKKPTTTLANMIHEEFLLYCSTRELSLIGLESPLEFWRQLQDENSAHFEQLSIFRDIYCFRAVTVYMFKIRFLNILMREIKQPFNVAHMANPSNLITKLFRPGSSSELVCDSFRPNCYSWFRPCSDKDQVHLDKLRHILENTHITGMVKMCSFKTINTDALKNKKVFDDSPYSHSLSHCSFGRFLTLNLVYMPQWLNEKTHTCPTTKPKTLGVIKTKFTGDQLTSLCLSHWLAQEDNVNKVWEDIICPDFEGKDFTDGSFVKICHELQFLTFLVKVAKEQDFSVLQLISKIMREKYETSSNGLGQFSLFSREQGASTGGFKRIVLNLINQPKSNPHQHLISKVREQLKDLDRDGWLFVLTNQKLFVPSRTDKLQQLLGMAKVHAGISLENVKGKGEIPNYLYVFTHRDLKTFPANARESYQNFQWDGELKMFSQFSWFAKEFENFVFSKKAYATPLFQAEKDGLSYNFHQDALFEGKLLTSANEDNSQITHPSFFKKLTGRCVPFDQFFQLETLEYQATANAKEDFLGLMFKTKQHHPYVLIVDNRDPGEMSLELISSEAYKAKREEYGNAYFHYFGLMPKMNNLNPNLFKTFFNSVLGKQLIQLSLGGSTSNLKSKLSSTLIPGFFAYPKFYSSDVTTALSILEKTSNDLLATHPKDVEAQFEMSERIIRDSVETYSWHSLSMLSSFKVQLMSASQSLEKSPEVINYQNPLILTPLLELSAKPLLPHHDDLYVKVITSDRPSLNLKLETVNFNKFQQNCSLELLHKGEVIIELHGSEEYLHFVRFILTGSLGAPISQILHGLQLPSASDLQKVVSNYRDLSQMMTKLQSKTQILIENILQSQLR